MLVVSDGFYTYADEKQIARLVKELPKDIDALTMARHLVEYARNAGGRRQHHRRHHHLLRRHQSSTSDLKCKGDHPMANTFSGVVHQNKFLASGAVDVNAIVSIKSLVTPDGGAARAAAKLVVGFVGDGSGSMSGEKWRNAKQALIDSVGKLPESCEFFVIIRAQHTGHHHPGTAGYHGEQGQSAACARRYPG